MLDVILTAYAITLCIGAHILYWKGEAGEIDW